MYTLPQVSSEEGMTQCHVGCMDCVETWTDWRPSQTRNHKANVSLVFVICLPIVLKMTTYSDNVRKYKGNTYLSVISWRFE